MDNSWLQQDCFYSDKRDRVARVIGHLRGNRRERPIIEDHGRPFAIVDPRAAMRRGLRHEMTLDKVAWPVPKVQNGDDRQTVLERFADSGAPYLPAYVGRPPRKAGYLDAHTFLRSAFDDGPDANHAAQGVPLLWDEASVEEAIQSFAASALPYLPVEGKNGLVGIIRREALFPYIEQDAQRMSRQDLAGDRADFRDETIESLVEPGPPTLHSDAHFQDVLRHFENWPCLFVEHGFVEAVTPVAMLQAIRADQQRPKGPPTHFRQNKTADTTR